MDATPLERHDTVVRGDRGELRVEGGRITIAKGATTQAEPTEVTATLSDLRGATVSPASGDQPAWLHMAVVGGSIAPTNALTALSDPWTLPLTGRSLGSARRFARMVERHVRTRGRPPDDGQQLSSGVTVHTGPVPDPTEAGEHAVTLVDKLRELAELHDAGILTEQEFALAKAQVLGERPDQG